VPDERSLHAGERLLAWLDALPAGVGALFLISGGASSLVEVLVPGVTLAQLARVSRLGLAAGRDIVALNAERARYSQIKGGRLAARLAGRAARALLISDVPGDDPAVIGSGILAPAAGGDDIRRDVIASIDMAMDAVVEAARARDLTVRRATGRFAGDAARLATQFTHELALGEAQVRVWGGESTVQLPPSPGRGGRNQHLALAAARLIAGYGDLALLAAGTDGIDGPTLDAGAVVDGETCGRIAVHGLDPDESLRRADSGSALAAAGALLRTGPTGTNVADLVIGFRRAPRRLPL
jgi:hydroxypyruvate reductase